MGIVVVLIGESVRVEVLLGIDVAVLAFQCLAKECQSQFLDEYGFPVEGSGLRQLFVQLLNVGIHEELGFSLPDPKERIRLEPFVRHN